MRSGILAMAAAAGLTLFAPGNAHAETIDVARFRQLRAEGVAAASSGDLEAAADRLRQAAAIMPTHTGLILMQARIAAAGGHAPEAIVFLSRYADFGLIADIAADPLFAEVVVDSGFAPVAEQLRRNRASVGEPSAILRDDQLHLLEGLAWNSGGDELLVSSIRDHTIYRIDDGGLVPWLQPAQSLGIYGLAIDEGGDRLWAASVGSPESGATDTADTGRTELLEIELSSGRILARHAPPPAPRRNFGDVAVAGDGTVSVSDSTTGEVFLLRPGGSGLEPLIGPGAFGSPQGMAFSPDAGLLLIADYSAGLYRIDLRTREVAPVMMPDGLTLISTDGMALSGDGALWLVQNGVSPSRLMRLELTSDWRGVVEATVEAANLEYMDQPSGLAIGADAVLFIQQSQWGRFDREGRPRADRTDTAVISALPLARLGK
ncbi:hypothetical protein [Brevundimonas sp.]|uniref:hypothetical protein n=1 Tax=Brevundimonas sp. TaxID=1871086 RepID=UPI00286D5992|nr:hypothetical protein [Brevundimonas sp.]